MIIEYLIESLKESKSKNSVFNEFVCNIERDYYNGNIENAIDKIDVFTSREKKASYNRSRLFLLMSIFYNCIGSKEQAIKNYETIPIDTEFIKDEYKIFQIEYYLTKIELIYSNLDSDERKQIIEEIEYKIQLIWSMDELKLHVLLNFYESLVLRYDMRIDEAIKILIHTLAQIEFLKNPKNNNFERSGKYYYLSNLGISYYIKGHLDLALENFQKGLEIIRKLDNRSILYKALNNIGVIFLSKGPLETAEKYFKESSDTLNELDKKTPSAINFLNIARLYYSKGLLDQSLDFCKQSYQNFENNYMRKDMAFSLALMANIYLTKGLLDKALENGEKSLHFFQEEGDRANQIEILWILSKIHRAKNNIEIAIEFCNSSLSLTREKGFNEPKTRSLLTAIELFLVKKDLIQANTLMEEIAAIANESKNSKNLQIQLVFRYSKALVLKHNPRLKSKVLAQEEFKAIISNSIIDFDIYSSALIHLIELLIDEFTLYNEPTVLDELKEQISTLHQKALEQGAYGLLTNSYLLQARLALIYGELMKAEFFIAEAIKTAKEHGLSSLYEKAITTNDKLTKELHNWEKLLKSNAPLKDRFQESELKEYLDEVRDLLN